MTGSNDVLVETPSEFSKGRVAIGGVEVPGYIERDGIEIFPSGGNDTNRLRVTFLVGEVTVKSADGGGDA